MSIGARYYMWSLRHNAGHKQWYSVNKESHAIVTSQPQYQAGFPYITPVCRGGGITSEPTESSLRSELEEGRRFAIPNSGSSEPLHRRIHPAFAVRHAVDPQAHLHGAQRSQDHRLVQIAHVPDAEHLAAEPAQAATR